MDKWSPPTRHVPPPLLRPHVSVFYVLAFFLFGFVVFWRKGMGTALILVVVRLKEYAITHITVFSVRALVCECVSVCVVGGRSL